MNKLAKERIIFQNYDLDGYEKYYRNEYGEDEDFSENAMYQWIDDMVSINFEDTFRELKAFFHNKIIAFGSVGRWNGVYDGSKVFNNFKDAYWAMTKDCDYVKIYDENGHLFIHCSHHDGSCSFEIKELTKKGEEYFDRWEYSRDCHNQIIKRYSKIPNFAHKVYGMPKVENEKPTKENMQKKLFNEAKSFYS